MNSSQKNKVSIQAFIEEIENWQLTLGREQKKLKSLRTKVKSKINLNQLDILITELEGELIRYRKLKDPNKIQYLDIIHEYNQCTRKFMDIMENVGNFAEKIQNEPIFEPSLEADEIQIEKRQNAGREKYLNQTFTYTIAKQKKFSKADTSPYRPQTKVMSSKGSINHIERKNSNNRTVANLSNAGNITTNMKKTKNLSSKGTPNSSLCKIAKNGEDFDSWEIKYQLKEIKSMISQIQNQIKYHSHEDIEVQLSKIQHNNKKMSLQVKSLKEDSQFIMTRIQKLKDQLATQKEIQNQMIQQFQNPHRASRKSKSKSIQDSRRNVSHQQEQIYSQSSVSQWVRVRI